MDVSRRDFLKTTAAATVASTLGVKLAIPTPASAQQDVDKWVRGTCRYCGVG
ncbi:MAG TPA: twin-arginine translocation signal domain-containing protein, partial [Bacteroidetes bacterium]|nr:twin-arginine translocation signal domain-containing protein [Bacteroidota bacterium]